METGGYTSFIFSLHLLAQTPQSWTSAEMYQVIKNVLGSVLSHRCTSRWWKHTTDRLPSKDRLFRTGYLWDKRWWRTKPDRWWTGIDLWAYPHSGTAGSKADWLGRTLPVPLTLVSKARRKHLPNGIRKNIERCGLGHPQVSAGYHYHPLSHYWRRRAWSSYRFGRYWPMKPFAAAADPGRFPLNSLNMA